MSFKNLLFAATLASSSLVSGSDVPSLEHVRDKISHKTAASLNNKEHPTHLHAEVFAGIEHNHLLDHGQLMEGDFTSFGIHASLNNWWAYYHWLQAEKSSLEHKAGIVYEHSLNNSFILKTGLSGIYEVAWSEHGSSHLRVSEESSSHDPHKDTTHHKPEKHEPVLDSTFYAAVSAEVEGILSQGENHKTSFKFWGEYDLWPLDTFFMNTGLEHVQKIGGIDLITRAKIINVITTDSTHVQEWILWVAGLWVKIPFWKAKKWFLDLDGQITTRGDTAGKFGFSRTF